MSLDELPRTGPVADFAREGEVLVQPSDPRRPWVLADEHRVLKAYDLRAFDALDRRRALAEAETAVALSGLEGVVRTYRAEQVGAWLVIEMERLGETVAERLGRIAAGQESPLPPARWGELLEEVAQTLARVHRRKIVHRDVKPSNLMFDRSGSRLLVADFSIASRGRRRSTAEGDVEVAGTRRYIAPEVFQGRLGFAADQYGLAITAEEALGDSITVAAGAVLMRATEQEPEDRYPAIEDFGAALRNAIDDRTPYRVSSRLRRVSPAWRSTWGTGMVTFAACYALLLVLRIPDLSWTVGLLAPSFGAGIVMLSLRAVNFIRRKRTAPRLALANQPWVPLAIFVALVLISRPLYADQPSKVGKYVLYSWLAAVLAVAALGSVPRNPGEGLIRLTQRWERWRHAQPRTRGRRLRLLGVAIAGLALISALPAAIGAHWPSGRGAKPVAAAPAVTVAASRSALLSDEPRRACAFVRVPPDRGVVGCRRWAPVAADWLRQDLKRRGAPAFRSADLENLRISEVHASTRSADDYWSVWTDDGDRRAVATVQQTDEDGKVWEVQVTRGKPEDDPAVLQEAFWGYEVVREDKGWRITGIEICDFGTHQDCVRAGHIEADDWKAIRRQGPPERDASR
ncbi:MAG TPA: protein kinase [Solirubrobacterales bacterium]|nr:protein kinase [Solirubrobacterales bacterium]